MESSETSMESSETSMENSETSMESCGKYDKANCALIAHTDTQQVYSKEKNAVTN
jgi:hypothetical protein